MPFRLSLVIALALPLSCTAAVAQEDSKTLETLDARVREEPGNPRLWAARASALSRLGRIPESLESFDKSLAISPKFLQALQAAAEIAYNSRDPRAAAYLNRILEQSPANPTAHAMAGALAYEAQDCRAANSHFATASVALAGNADALARWGECLVQENQPVVAAAKLSQALQLRPGDRRLTLQLAAAEHLSGAEARALSLLTHLPKDGAAMNLRAAIFTTQERFADAVNAYREAMRLNPAAEANYIDLASLCLEHQSFQVAADVVNAGLVSLPRSAALYTMRGAIKAQSSEPEQAAADFERASQLAPSEFYGQAGLSLLYEQQDQLDQAEAVLRPKLKASPDNAVLHFLLADVLLKRQELAAGGRSEARTCLETAIRLKPEMSQAHALLGKLELQEGNGEAAVTESRKALAQNPSDRIALNQLVLALRKLGRKEEARQAAEQLKENLAQGRRDEVHSNTVRFVRTPLARHP
ncbi:MAG: tetratricopeptide repeat protein [Acidobacteriota bacterium]|nr:tetratricopeptide repeat protein [Acidobacteriota bacterium]